MDIEESLCGNTTFHLNFFSFLSISSLYGGIPELILVNLIVCFLLFPFAGIFWFMTDYLLQGNGLGDPLKNWSMPVFLTWVKGQAFDQRTIFNTEWLFLDKEYLTDKYGEDSMQYLCFQRYLISLLTVFTVLTLSTLLPVNMAYGTKFVEPGDFAKMTMGNLDVSSNHLWVHVFLGWCFLPISCLFMKCYARNILSDFIRFSEFSGSTLVVSDIPISCRNEVWIREWFREKYPFVRIEDDDIYLTYNTGSLHPHFELYDVWNLTLRKMRRGESVDIHHCMCPCRCLKVKEDGRTYYLQRKQETRDTIVDLWHEVRKVPLAVAFVQVENHRIAQFVVACEKISRISNSSDTVLTVKIAPRVEGNIILSRIFVLVYDDVFLSLPEIEWRNLVSNQTICRRKTAAIIGLTLFMIFLTTPQAFFNTLFQLTQAVGGATAENIVTSSAFAFFITVLKVIMRSLITSLINYAIKYIGYWRHLEINRDILSLATLYLIIALIVMPTLGFLTIQSIITAVDDWVRSKLAISESIKHQWNCVFLPQGGLIFGKQTCKNMSVVGLPNRTTLVPISSSQLCDNKCFHW